MRMIFQWTLGLAIGSLITTAQAARAEGTAPSCLQETGYPSVLRVPSLETWAGNENSAESECLLTQKLVASFAKIEEKIALESPNKRRLRGTHAKGVCLKGTFTAKLGETLSPEQKSALLLADLFGSDHALPVRFRFANASSRIEPDWNADVRALSLKVSLPNGAEQDFAMNNVPRFEIDTLDNFVHVMELQTGIGSGQIPVDPQTHQPGKLALFSYFRNLYGIFDAASILYELSGIENRANEDLKWHGSYTTQNYWSTTAFALANGPSDKIRSANQVVKFAAAPCLISSTTSALNPLHSSQVGRVELASAQSAQDLAQSLVKSGQVTTAENYLSESLFSQVRSAPVCYTLFAQFLKEEESIAGHRRVRRVARKLVEDPSRIWNGPIHTVGQLEIQESLDASVCDDPSQFVSVTEHGSNIYALGQINRARNFVEAASWKSR